jgi:O-antigen/teichoic acid export membrane protein
MFKKIASTFVVKIVTSVINLMIVILLSQYLGASGKGEASLLITGITMVLLFCNMMGGSTLVYLVPRFNIPELIIISNLWSVIVCTAAYFLLSTTNILPQQFVVHVSVLSFINSLLATNLTVLLGKEKINSNNLVILLQSVISLFLFFILLKSTSGADISYYIQSLYAAMLTALVISTFLIIPYFKRTSSIGFKKISFEMIRYGFINQASHMTKFASSRLSFFLLSHFNNKAGLGIFSNGISLTESVLLITNSIASVQYPAIANSTDHIKSQQLTLRLCRISTLFCIAAMAPIVLLPASFYTWLFGSEFGEVKNVVWLLAPGIIFYNTALIIGHYFSGTGKYIVNTWATILGLIVTLVLSLIVLSNYTIENASIISSVSYFFITLLLLYVFMKESSIRLVQFVPSINDMKWMKEYFFSLLKSDKSTKLRKYSR